MARTVTVDAFLASSGHSRLGEVQRLRAALLAGCPELSEQVKWNAPSFGVGGDDRVTFRLQPGDRVELVLHRGVARRADVESFRFDDPAGLVRWVTPDRGSVVVVDAADLEERLPAIVGLVQRWVAATV